MTWLPVACILLYVVTSIIGVLPIPNMLLAELFPLEIRGTGYSIGYSICCMIMFSALQSYYTLSNILGGAKNLQWFFSVTCLGALVYSYIFLPETKGVKLTDINTYFKHQSVYIGSHKKKRLEETDNNNRVWWYSCRDINKLFKCLERSHRRAPLFIFYLYTGTF